MTGRWTVRGGVTLVISVHILKLSKKGTVNYFTYDQVSSICVTVQIIQTDPDHRSHTCSSSLFIAEHQDQAMA